MKKRCPWLNCKNSRYMDYHDREWGRPSHNDTHLFEMLTLEGAQAGLSWEIILNKREGYRKAFKGFDPQVVSKFSLNKVEQLINDPSIVRNRLKIESTVSNAFAFLSVQKEFKSFDRYIWSFVKGRPIINSFKDLSEYPTKTPLSDEISKDLKKRGFKFVGTTIIYAYMQAIGMVQDHSQACFLHKKRIRALT